MEIKLILILKLKIKSKAKNKLRDINRNWSIIKTLNKRKNVQMIKWMNIIMIQIKEVKIAYKNNN